MPINDGLFGKTPTHWTLLICDIKIRRLFSIDSTYTEEEHFKQLANTIRTSRNETVIQKLQQDLFNDAQYLYMDKLVVKQEQTENDCGPFILMYIQKFVTLTDSSIDCSSIDFKGILTKLVISQDYDALKMRKEVLTHIMTTQSAERAERAREILNKYFSVHSTPSQQRRKPKKPDARKKKGPKTKQPAKKRKKTANTSDLSEPSTLMSSTHEIPDPNKLTKTQLQEVSEAIKSLSSEESIAEECVNWYSRHLMDIYKVDFNAFVTSGSIQSYLVDETRSPHEFFMNKMLATDSRYLFLPINDAMTGLHWGLIVIDKNDLQVIFLDPLYDAEIHRQDVDKNLNEIDSYLNQDISKIHEILHQLQFQLIIVPVPQKQTTNDCGVYVLQYMRGLIELLTSNQFTDQSLLHAADRMIQQPINTRESRQEIKVYLQSLQPPTSRNRISGQTKIKRTRKYPVKKTDKVAQKKSKRTIRKPSDSDIGVPNVTHKEFLNSLPGELSNRQKRRRLKLHMIQQALQEAEELFQDSLIRPKLETLAPIDLTTPKINVAACEKTETTKTTAKSTTKVGKSKKFTTKPKASGKTNATKSLKPPKKQMIDFHCNSELPEDSNSCSILSFDIETREVDQLPVKKLTKRLNEQRQEQNEVLKNQSDSEREVWIEKHQVFMISGVFGHFIKDEFYLQESFVATSEESTFFSEGENPTDCHSLFFFEDEKQLLEFLSTI
ncbi:hypothetical protein GEMRC1_011364 [Eukaryota sp. GEM-RC1]